MANKNIIGLNDNKAKKLAEELNILLANYQLFYINARGFHWNIKGHKFFELHVKFEEIYTNALTKIDEIAERILTIGHTPLHTFTDYLKVATIGEVKDFSEGDKCIKSVLESYKTLIKQERELSTIAADAGDEGTVALMSDYIREQEKEVWMYSAYLN